MADGYNQKDLEATLRTDLAAFVHKVFQTLCPHDDYHDNWHIDAIAYELVRCLKGDNTRLLINQPPRTLKSVCVSVAFVAWALGNDPTLKFVCVSYSKELAEDLADKCRRVITSTWYRALFPAMRIAKNTASEVTTTRGGGRFATSIGGTLTGQGGSIVIIDDPMKAEDAASRSARLAVIDWYKKTLVTRLDDKRSGSIIVVMQRLHEEDLAGKLLEAGGWHHLNLPAIAIEDQTIQIGPGPAGIHHRKEGDVLHPAREPMSVLDQLRRELGSHAFSAQYQQQPIPADGDMIKRDWFKWYDDQPEVTPQSQIVQSWDIAASRSERSDWSVCTTWMILNKDYYLLDVWRDRLEFPDLRRKVIDLQRAHAADSVLIEKAGLGLNLVQELRAESPDGFPKPIGIKPEGNKITRMQAATPRIEAGHVILPRDAPWLDTFLHELLAFPNGKHDDQVDSVSQFLHWARKRAAPNASDYLVGARLIYLEPDY